MTNELQVFENPRFGAIRTLEEGGKVLFCGKDVCAALGYSNTRDALSRHCKGVVKRDTPTQSGIQEMNFIPEGDIYRLAAKSELPGADKFESWIFDDVLPSIRKHGAYISDKSKQMAIEAKHMNARARVAAQWTKIAGQVNIPEFKQICASYASEALAGVPVLPLPTSGERHYKAGEIGDMFGVTSQRIGLIANANGLKTDEYGKWYHDKSPHSNKEVDSFRYNSKAIEKFKEILGN
jgi:prophage antirepressor-like protein